MENSECSLCYRVMPMTNEGLMMYYCRILHVNAICDECLTNIENSRKEYFARKEMDKKAVIGNGGKN